MQSYDKVWYVGAKAEQSGTLSGEIIADFSGALFVDDKAMNIVGANEAGIRGVRFKDARALRTLLIDAGVAIPAVHEK